MTQDQMRVAFENSQMMAGCDFTRRTKTKFPEQYGDGNVEDDWRLWQEAVLFALLFMIDN